MVQTLISIHVLMSLVLKSAAALRTENEVALSLLHFLKSRQCLLVTISGAFDSFQFLTRRNISTISKEMETFYFDKVKYRWQLPETLILNIDYEASTYELDMFFIDHVFTQMPSSISWIVFGPPDFLEVSVILQRFPYRTEFIVVEKMNDEHYTIKESYSYRENSWLKDLGVWTRENGLKVDQVSLLKRRSDLNGVQLVITNLMNNCPEVKMDCENIAFWYDLGMLFNFTTIEANLTSHGASNLTEEVKREEEGEEEKKEEEKEEEEEEEEEDFEEEFLYGIDAWTKVIPLRGFILKSVINPIFEVRLYMHLREPRETHTWTTYFRPFQSDLWKTIGSWLAFCFLTFIIANSIQTRRYNLKDILSTLPYGFAALDAMCNQDGIAYWQEISRRIMLMVSRVAGYIITGHYSATLISFLTVTRINLPFTTFQEFTNNTEYTLGLPYYSFEQWAILHLINQTQLEPEILMYEDMIDKVCFEKYVFISPARRLDIPECRITMIEKQVESSYTGLQLGTSELAPLFNDRLSYFRTSGVLQRMQAKFQERKKHRRVETLRSVDMEVVFPLYIFLWILSSMALLIFVLEIIVHNIFRPKSKTSIFYRMRLGVNFVKKKI